MGTVCLPDHVPYIFSSLIINRKARNIDSGLKDQWTALRPRRRSRSSAVFPHGACARFPPGPRPSLPEIARWRVTWPRQPPRPAAPPPHRCTSARCIRCGSRQRIGLWLGSPRLDPTPVRSRSVPNPNPVNSNFLDRCLPAQL